MSPTSPVDRCATLGAWDDRLLDGWGSSCQSSLPGRRLVAAAGTAVYVISEIELGVRLLPNRLIGVTGTNGKTTTTALLGAVLR